MSGAGASITIGKPLLATKTAWGVERKMFKKAFAGSLEEGGDDEEEFECWHVEGTPVDCVNTALNGNLLYGKKGEEKEEKWIPDLVISGCNYGANIGTSVFFSGTVGAAIAAAVCDYPAIAISLDFYPRKEEEAGRGRILPPGELHWETARVVLEQVLELVAGKEGGVKRFHGCALNVNVPNVPAEEFQGLKLTHQGKSGYANQMKEQKQPQEQQEVEGEEKRWYRMGGFPVDRDGGSKEYEYPALIEGHASVTPLCMFMCGEGYEGHRETLKGMGVC